jgi:hypothetical protein
MENLVHFIVDCGFMVYINQVHHGTWESGIWVDVESQEGKNKITYR